MLFDQILFVAYAVKFTFQINLFFPLLEYFQICQKLFI